MGRSFESVRKDIKEVSASWLKASRALKKEDQVCGQRLEEMAKRHSSEALYNVIKLIGGMSASAEKCLTY
jgi:hypothetical protein